MRACARACVVARPVSREIEGRRRGERAKEKEGGREREVALGSRESRHARALVDATSSFLT